MHVMTALLKNVALQLQTHQWADNCKAVVFVSVAKTPFIPAFIQRLLYVQCNRKSRMMKLFEMAFQFLITTPSGVPVCLFGKWLLTLCALCATEEQNQWCSHPSILHSQLIRVWSTPEPLFWRLLQSYYPNSPFTFHLNWKSHENIWNAYLKQYHYLKPSKTI